ncbi:hypothetical protein [Streptomyces sp. CB01881]|uniref:hypothetical protein n=1 Tax=Streptomyces sp. CB01881 TaxID=2078691 RepID=UPI00129C7058|nr:hypothetical protein [Streptomyces sp. CB01881]
MRSHSTTSRTASAVSRSRAGASCWCRSYCCSASWHCSGDHSPQDGTEQYGKPSGKPPP